MNMNKYTIKAQEAVQEAVKRAERQGQQAIEPEHLLSGILQAAEEVTRFIFQKLGLNPTTVQQAVDAQIGSLPKCREDSLTSVSNPLKCCRRPKTWHSREATSMCPWNICSWPSPMYSARLARCSRTWDSHRRS